MAKHDKEGSHRIVRNGNIIEIYLCEDIGEPQAYVDVYTTIKMANSHEEVRIILNSVGGRLDTALQILNSIYYSEARVVGIAEGMLYSAAGMIFLGCHGWQVGPFARFMAHNPTTGFIGTMSEIMDDVEFTVPWLKELLTRLYSGFMTQKEVDQMIQGKEFYFNTEEIGERLHNYVKHVEKAAKKSR